MRRVLQEVSLSLELLGNESLTIAVLHSSSQTTTVLVELMKRIRDVDLAKEGLPYRKSFSKVQHVNRVTYEQSQYRGNAEQCSYA